MNIHNYPKSFHPRIKAFLETQPTRIRSRGLDPARAAYAQTNARNPLFMLRYANRKTRLFQANAELAMAS